MSLTLDQVLTEIRRLPLEDRIVISREVSLMAMPLNSDDVMTGGFTDAEEPSIRSVLTKRAQGPFEPFPKNWARDLIEEINASSQNG